MKALQRQSLMQLHFWGLSLFSLTLLNGPYERGSRDQSDLDSVPKIVLHCSST